MLLSRVADNLYWGARYLERAEDTSRIVRAYTELVIDLPTSVLSTWEPLLAVAGSSVAFQQQHEGGGGGGEMSIVRFMVADRTNPSSVASSIDLARENLRTTREVMPREAWQTVNDLYLSAGANASGGVDRRGRARFLTHVIGECQRLDGVLTTVMNRDEAYELWRLGQSIERADMTTRVVGVRAAAIMRDEHAEQVEGAVRDIHDEVQWMGLLRSVSGLQMYQRTTRGPIDGRAAVRFLLHAPAFPRSVASCVQRIREALGRLPHADITMPAVAEVERLLAATPVEQDSESVTGAELDAAMDRLQLGLASIDDAVRRAFVRSAA